MRTYIQNRVLLASRPGTQVKELITVFKRALECNEVLTGELRKKDPSVKNSYEFFSEALSAARSTQASDHHLPLLEFLCSPSMRQHVDAFGNAREAIQHHALCALHAKVEPDRVRKLLFPLQTKLHNFADVLFSFSASAAIAWVSGLVEAQEEHISENKFNTLASVAVFSDPVTRQAAPVLAKSTLPGFRLQSLRFLPEPQVDAMAQNDQDYNVRAVAKVLIASRESTRRSTAPLDVQANKDDFITVNDEEFRVSARTFFKFGANRGVGRLLTPSAPFFLTPYTMSFA